MVGCDMVSSVVRIASTKSPLTSSLRLVTKKYRNIRQTIENVKKGITANLRRQNPQLPNQRRIIMFVANNTRASRYTTSRMARRSRPVSNSAMAGHRRRVRPAIDKIDMFPDQRSRQCATHFRSEVDFVEVIAGQVCEDRGEQFAREVEEVGRHGG